MAVAPLPENAPVPASGDAAVLKQPGGSCRCQHPVYPSQECWYQGMILLGSVPFTCGLCRKSSAVMQALPHALHLPGQQHHLPMQTGLESYIPLMPSLSLDSFFASCDEREAAHQRAQQPPAMMENVLPAWGEDLNNAPGGSLQAAADWQACTSPFHCLPCIRPYLQHGADFNSAQHA